MDFIINAAIQYLSERNMSEKGLREQLCNDFKGLSDLESLIEFSIARLKELHLINDFRIAESLSQRFSHKGNHFIKQTLQQKGINEEVIAQALARLDDESVRALQEARKKWHTMHSNQSENTKAILHRFLTGRGFSPMTIHSALRKLTQEGNLAKEKRSYKNYPTIDKLINQTEGNYRSLTSIFAQQAAVQYTWSLK